MDIQIERILVPTDFSEHSQRALDYAAELAVRFEAHLQLLHVTLSPVSMYPEQRTFVPPEELKAKLREKLRTKLEQIPVPAQVRVSHHVRVGPPPVEILLHAKQHGVDLIVAGTHGRTGVPHLLMGSVAERLVRKAKCPVLTICRSKQPFQLKRIAVATDFGRHADNALCYAVALADRFETELHLLHVVHDPTILHPELSVEMVPLSEWKAEMEAVARKQLDELSLPPTSVPLTVKRALRLGSPYAEITRYAGENQIDLIVQGTHGRNALKQVLIGSVAEKVVRYAKCPVMTVHHPEHEFVMP